jgi:hypothetical protein
MELRKVKYELNLDEWRKLVYECRNSGQTIRAWCEDHHISTQTYYRWQRAVWDAGKHTLPELSKQQSVVMRDENAVFAEYPLPAPIQSVPAAAVVLRLNTITLEIQNGVHPQTIETIIKAVKTLC